MTSTGLEKLDVWRKARDLAIEVYRIIIPKLPDYEKYNLSSQIRRAAISVPANIAEGYGRFYYQSNIHFCYIARGSLEELISHLILVFDLGLVPKEDHLRLLTEANNLVLLINGYISYLKRSKQGENEPGNLDFVKENSENYLVDQLEIETDGSHFSNIDSHPEGS